MLGGRAFLTEYNGNEVLSISLNPFEYIGQHGLDPICFGRTPETVGDYFKIGLRVPAKVGSASQGPSTFPEGGLLLNFVHYEGSVIRAYGALGTSIVTNYDDEEISGTINISYLVDGHSMTARGAYTVKNCGSI